jgi:hypothetical protein
VKSLRHINLQLSGVDIVLPALVCIEGQADRSLGLIIGFAERYADGMIASLVGQWLLHLLRRPFLERDRCGDSNLAATALYDKLSHDFGSDNPFVAAIALRKELAANVPIEISPFAPATVHSGKGRNFDNRALSKFIICTEFARWHICGGVHAFLNPNTVTAHVTFDELPGGIDLIGAGRLPASAARTLERTHRVSAWYGFGAPLRSPADAVMKLRNKIR